MKIALICTTIILLMGLMKFTFGADREQIADLYLDIRSQVLDSLKPQDQIYRINKICDALDSLSPQELARHENQVLSFLEDTLWRVVLDMHGHGDMGNRYSTEYIRLCDKSALRLYQVPAVQKELPELQGTQIWTCIKSESKTDSTSDNMINRHSVSYWGIEDAIRKKIVETYLK